MRRMSRSMVLPLVSDSGGTIPPLKRLRAGPPPPRETKMTVFSSGYWPRVTGSESTPNTNESSR
jgi:hypothetical protein